MKLLDYKDSEGRWFRVQLPDDAPDEDAKYGNIIGPPLLDDLELPTVLKVRLHNELFHRGLLTIADIRTRRSEVVSALQHTFTATAERIEEIYSA